jgi:hypothetical protein
MMHKQEPSWTGRRLVFALISIAVALALTPVKPPVQAVGVTPVSPTMECSEEPPTWWYAPDKPLITSGTVAEFDQPEWWHAPQDVQALSALDFTIMDIEVSLHHSSECEHRDRRHDA